MIVQACINGARKADHHPRLPLTTDAMVKDSLACLEAGASELHIHPRAPDGRESLAAVGDFMAEFRRNCPGTLVGVSTGEWIEADRTATLSAIANWSVLPDYASVNLSEAQAPEVMALLRERGVGIEAGLASAADAERLAAVPGFRQVFRVLIEIGEQQVQRADGMVQDILKVLQRSGVTRPILLHGFDATVWHFVRRARQYRFSTRVGLEDGAQMPDG
ncbi:MAG: 3-keto-5-aminohexanoate cleavage protein, partial [Rhizobiales bacterium]|nr:3-keto-5-aminohexanoate cleavage protein [Hyphomicrobiales bacterium]